MGTPINRRQAFVAAGALTAAQLWPTSTYGQATDSAAKTPENSQPIRYCFNTSTIRGQKLSLPDQIQVIATAGYHGIEPWLGDVHQHASQGNSLVDLRKQIADADLTVESAIGFARWIVDDDSERAQGLRDAERDMEAIKTIGGTRIAAPPVGATGPMNLDLIAERYHALLEIGAKIGVVPQLELWGHSPAIHRLSQLVYIATAAGHPDACLLPDVYHIYKGGSAFDGLRMIAGNRINVFHMNDYPEDPPRESISDEHRVYPGDGVAPTTQIVRDLYTSGFRGAFSLELFNREYWKQDPLEVAKTGLQKMQNVVQTALPAISR